MLFRNTLIWYGQRGFVDSLMLGLAVFSLKFPSLLQFEENKLTQKIKNPLSVSIPLLYFNLTHNMDISPGMLPTGRFFV
ncbi:MAG: hypothetical protein A3F41_07340 [Coxiella sp. RIFCSPHIGHO2_12_FULL_44_14]|nr:MAG: hypothetical protein A3F41_07340 [Coxiella sp. RIFCSPHIGHO2_12_FULL_44_14]